MPKNDLILPIGQHILLDLYDCVSVNDDWSQLKKIFTKGLKLGNFTVITEHHHAFEPHGVSGVFVLAESHCSFHIWVELNFISLDVYWCGKNCDEQQFINAITEYFQPKKIDYKYLDRGFFE